MQLHTNDEPLGLEWMWVWADSGRNFSCDVIDVPTYILTGQRSRSLAFHLRENINEREKITNAFFAPFSLLWKAALSSRLFCFFLKKLIIRLTSSLLVCKALYSNFFQHFKL